MTEKDRSIGPYSCGHRGHIVYSLVVLAGGFCAFCVAADRLGWPFPEFIPLQLAKFCCVIALAYIVAPHVNRTYRRIADRESLFRMLTEEIRETVWRQDRNGVITYISPADQRMRGYRADEVVGRPVVEMLTQEGYGLALEAAARGRPRVVLPVRHKDGRALWIDVAVTVELDARGDVIGYHGVSRDVTERVIGETHEAFRSGILEMMTGSHDLTKILLSIVTGIEKIHPAMLCSILLVDSDGRRLGHGIAPSLPDDYNAAIDGIEIGVGTGSCGTAAFLGELVVVEDISTHPYWTLYQGLAARAGLRACWSQPIRSSSDQILGTFAIYHREAVRPTDADVKIIEQSARLASIAIETRRVYDDLRESHLFAQSILDSVLSQIAVVNEAGIIVSVNDAWRRFALENSNEAGRMAPNTDIGANYLEICGSAPEANAENLDVRSGIQAVLEGRLSTYSLEYPCHSATQKRWFMMTATPLRTGKKGAVIVHNDISDRKKVEEQIQKLAFYDPLTNLPNRRLLQDRVAQSIAGSKRSGNYCAMLFLDLDNFKPLNDLHGHDVGDLLLIEAAHRLQKCLRETDTVARFGGDEFVVILEQLSQDQGKSVAQARLIAEKIHSALSAPYRLIRKSRMKDGEIIDHRCTVSIGVSLFNSRESDHETILKRADAAMYQAKQSGRNTISFSAYPSSSDALAAITPEKLIVFNWHSSYESGNPTIDDQHRRLFETANRLLSTILTDPAAAELDSLIDGLLRDVVQHFEDEEGILAAAGVPGCADHAAIHRQLVEKASKLVRRLRAGSAGIGELFEFLAHDVVACHMLATDREFFPYLNGRRITQDQSFHAS